MTDHHDDHHHGEDRDGDPLVRLTVAIERLCDAMEDLDPARRWESICTARNLARSVRQPESP